MSSAAALPPIGRSAIWNLAILYIGKTSGVLVAFLFLPMYNRLLGPDQFGVVAVVLSLQALLVLMDLGMSTMVSRELAGAESSPAALLRLIRTAESCLTGFYCCLLVALGLTKASGAFGETSWQVAIGIVALFWVLVLQNLYYSAMLARREYAVASMVQVIGSLVRACASAFVLAKVSSSLSAFVMTQLFVATFHTLIGRYYCLTRQAGGGSLKIVARPTWRDCIALIKQGRSLMLFSAAGAAAMQLDKPIVSALVSSLSLTPYFLATTLCMVPISLLAGPVAQYFQPKLLNHLGTGDSTLALPTLKAFVVVTVLVTGLPAVMFWFLRTPLITLWLGQRGMNPLVPEYVAILLPGFSIGALGFIPYTLLLSAKDYRFQARMSVGLTVGVLAAATFAASLANVKAICWVYAIYHCVSTMGSWLRAMVLGGTAQLGRFSLFLAMQLAVGIICIAAVIYVLI